MDAEFLLLQTTRKTWPRRCARKKIFKTIFRVSSQISLDFHIYNNYIQLKLFLIQRPENKLAQVFIKQLGPLLYKSFSKVMLNVHI